MIKHFVTAAAAGLLGLALPAFAQDGSGPPPGAERGMGNMGGRMGGGGMLAQRFAEMDADKDGFVSRAEFDAYRAQMRAARGGPDAAAPPSPPPAGRVDMFDRLDTDHDGKISLDEAKAAAAAMRARMGATPQQ